MFDFSRRQKALLAWLHFLRAKTKATMTMKKAQKEAMTTTQANQLGSNKYFIEF